MPGHTSAHGSKSKSHGDTSRGPKNSPFSSGFQGARKTSTKTTFRNSDNNKVNYQTSTIGKTNAKKAAAISKRNKIKKDMEDFANYTYQKPTGLGKISPITQFLDVTGIGEKTFNINKEYYTRNVIGRTNPKTGEAYGGTVEDFKTYMKGRGAGNLDAMGRTITTDNDGGGRVIIEKNVGGSTILTETKTESEKTADAKADEEYDTRKTKRRGRRQTILTSQSGATGNFVLGKRTLLGA